MSTKTNLRARTSRINYRDAERAQRKKLKIEEVGTPADDMPGTILSKPPIIAPNGNIFYPCQYCSKIFPQKTTSITHMKKCPNKDGNSSVEGKNLIKDESINNSEVQQLTVEGNENLNNSGSSTENKSPKKEIRITQNITLKEPYKQKQIMNDSSIYDYNEQDSDESFGEESLENARDDVNNKLCEFCNTLFDTPLDHLRHMRDCHHFPKTILPPDEIEKYFDAPNRNSCPICKKPLKTRNFRSLFIKHLLVHTSGIKHECSVCKKKFRRRDHMRLHESRHIVV